MNADKATIFVNLDCPMHDIMMIVLRSRLVLCGRYGYGSTYCFVRFTRRRHGHDRRPSMGAIGGTNSAMETLTSSYVTAPNCKLLISIRNHMNRSNRKSIRLRIGPKTHSTHVKQEPVSISELSSYSEHDQWLKSAHK